MFAVPDGADDEWSVHGELAIGDDALTGHDRTPPVGPREAGCGVTSVGELASHVDLSAQHDVAV